MPFFKSKAQPSFVELSEAELGEIHGGRLVTSWEADVPPAVDASTIYNELDANRRKNLAIYNLASAQPKLGA